MRTIVNQSYRQGVVTVVCDDGTFWIGQVRKNEKPSEPNDLIVEWKPLNSPPDGDPFADKRDIWDKIEEKILDEAK